MSGPTPALADRDPIAILMTLTRRVSGAESLEAALTAVTEAALLLLDADHASVRLLDPTHTTLLASARSGTGTGNPPAMLRSGEGIAGWVLASGQPVRVDDVLSDARFKPASAQGFAIRSMVAAPLCSGTSVFGVLSASSPAVAAFSARHETLAQLLANCSVPPLEKARLERLAMTDPLTLALNMRFLRAHLRRIIEQASDPAGGQSGPSLLFVDLDDFKRVNDVHGHLAGDAVLRGFADRVRALTRQLDSLVRRGGDEFALAMPSATLEQARAVAERVRECVAATPFDVAGRGIGLTVSIGVAAWDGRESAESLERRADRALYAAKSAGRDRVAVDQVPEATRRSAASETL